MLIKTLISISLLIAAFSVSTKPTEAVHLSSSIIELDYLLFDQGFNHCKLTLIEPIIAEDFEFYHDIAGQQNKQQFLQAMQSNICNNQASKPIRKLVKESLQVFPLKHNGQMYGAIQQGVHEFYLKQEQQPLRKTSIAKFSHLWLLKNGQWQLSRVLSFDHQKPE